MKNRYQKKVHEVVLYVLVLHVLNAIHVSDIIIGLWLQEYVVY